MPLNSSERIGTSTGVQSISRTYQQTIPTWAEMHNLIQSAFENGHTFFDAAEKYGPLKVKRILGEGLEL